MEKWCSSGRKGEAEGMKPIDKDKKYLVTGGAGFIGFHLSKMLLEAGARVIGLDNVNV